jgi:hypothetical protein
MRKVNVALCIACGLLGGVLSHYVWALPVHAQRLPTAPREVRAQSFVLVDARGNVEGVFSVDRSKYGPPIIKLLGGTRHELWKAGGNGIELVRGSSK